MAKRIAKIEIKNLQSRQLPTTKVVGLLDRRKASGASLRAKPASGWLTNSPENLAIKLSPATRSV